MQTDLSACRKC